MYETKEDCRLDVKALQPLISLDNPFFYDRIWDNEKKLEVAQLSPERTVEILQWGCKRHHIKIKLVLMPEVTRADDLMFYVIEMYALLNRLHYGDVRYVDIRKDLEAQLLENIKKVGLHTTFNMVLPEYNVSCLLDGGDWGSSVTLEFVKYIHTGEIVKPGIDPHLDDGHFKDR